MKNINNTPEIINNNNKLNNFIKFYLKKKIVCKLIYYK